MVEKKYNLAITILADIIAEYLNNKYSLLDISILSEDPIVITISGYEEIELMTENNMEKTNYELLENIIISVIDDIRDAFEVDCDYVIGTENIVEISIF